MRELPPSLRKLAFMVLGFLHLLQSPEIGVGSIIDAALAPPVSLIDVVIPNPQFPLANKLEFIIFNMHFLLGSFREIFLWGKR